jgi:predicted DNA-binding transcriptional regulator AlpA
MTGARRLIAQHRPSSCRVRQERERLPATRYLSLAAAAAYVSMSTKALRRRIDRGTGPRIAKVGGVIRIDIQDLDLWMRRQIVETS